MSYEKNDLVISKQDALLESERKIQRASHDTVESLRIIGRELIRIKDEALYEATGKTDFQEYVEINLKMQFKQAGQFMRASLALDRLEAQKLQLPYNQGQVVELAKLRTPEVQVGVWKQVLDFCDKEKTPATYDMVRSAVRAQRSQTGHFQRRAVNKKKKVELDLDQIGETLSTRTVWSDKGEEALARIRTICGDEVADAIDRQSPPVTEANLILWAGQESEMIKNLAYWVIMKQWSVKKALRYEADSIDSETTVAELSDLARSRGGKAYVEYQDIRLTVEISGA